MLSLLRRSKVAANDESEVDITPMLDVVFIMLIFFIVTASFVKESGFAVNKPAVAPLTEPQQPSIVLNVDANNTVRIQNRLVQVAAIKSTVVRLLAESPQSSVSVRVHPETTTRAMISVIDGIRSANVAYPAISISRT